jgi:hypothetical protein
MSKKIDKVIQRIMSEKARPKKDLSGRGFHGEFLEPLRDRLKTKYAAVMENPNNCFEYGNKEAVNYGKYGYQGNDIDGNRQTVIIPIPRLVAILFGLPAPKGRAGCGNRWCLNPRHYTENPNKWSIRPISREEDFSKRLLDSPEELRRKLQDAGILDNPELAKNRRIYVRAIMSDGTKSKTKMMATKILAYLGTLPRD